MAERRIKPILNLHDNYVKMNLINPYILGGLPGDGLIGHWKFDNNTNDELGLHNLVSANISYEQDRKGFANGAVRCTDNNSLLDVGSNWDVGTQLTLSYWINFSASNAPMLFYALADTDYHTLQYFNAGWVYTRSGATPFAFRTFSLNINRWYYLTFVRNGTTVNEYVDGVLILTGTNSISANSSKIKYFNKRVPNETELYFLNGRLDDVRIYNRVLTEPEILQLYNE